MPTRSKIVTRTETTSSNTTQNLNKGSKLTFAEMDSNFIELQNQTIGLVGDDSTGIDVGGGDTIKIAGTGGIQTSVSGDTVTIDASSIVTSSLGDITAVGSTLLSPSNADFTIQASGTGSIQLADSTNVTGDLTVTGSLNTDGITIEDNRITTSRSNDSLQFRANGTGDIELNPEASSYQQVVIRGGGEDGLGVIHPQLKIVDEQGTELLFGDNWGLASTGATIASGDGDILTLQGGNQNQNINARTPNFVIFSGTTGKLTLGQSSGTPTGRHPGEIATTYNVADGQGFDLKLNTGSSSATNPGKLLVGTGAHNSYISSNGAQNLILETNSGTNSGYLQIDDGTAGPIYLHTNGHGNITIGSNTGTGDGTAYTSIEGVQFKRFANSSSGEWMNIPMSADGSTSQDVVFQMNSGFPELYFNNAGSAVDDRAYIRVGTGGLNIQTDGANSSNGHIRIQSAGDITLSPGGVLNLGGNTIVVSGNRMYTDQSNEDLELLANGAGNISLLSPANMNSNKIINVTDPTSAQDAATKAYVDAQIGTATTLTTDGLTITDNNITGTRSNENIIVNPAGTGQIVLSSDTTVDGTLTATQITSDLTGTIEFDAKADVNILKGEVVYISGIDGNTPTVAKARANSASTMPAFGLAAEDITATNTGKITTIGSLTGLDVADFGETSITFSLGDTVYISATQAGKLTNVKPAGESNLIQNIGIIERASPTTNVTIKVGGAGRTNATPALNDGNIFIGNASNQSSTVSLSEQIKNYKAITLTGDDSTGTDINIGETFKIAGTQNITTAVSGDTLTITGPDLTSYITASSTDTLTNKTFDANGTGNSLSNVEVADFAASSIVTAAEGISANNNDITIPTSAAVKAYADSVGGAANTGDITFVGSTIISPSNADLVLNPSGTGSVNINAVYTLPNTDGTANQIMATNGSGVISFVDPTAINIDGGVADSIYVSVPTIDGGIA